MVAKLYGLAISTCTSRVRACLAEKDVAYELISVDLMSGEHTKPPFLAKNPFGLIPVYEEEDLTVFESRAINMYVSHKYKDQGTDLLHLGNLKESAIIGNWIEVEAQQFSPAIGPIVYQTLIMKLYGKPADQAIVDAHLQKLEKVLDVYEDRLSKTKFLAGDFFSLADLNHFSYTFYLMKTQYSSLINSRPRVKAWWEAVSSRPSSQKVAIDMTMA